MALIVVIQGIRYKGQGGGALASSDLEPFTQNVPPHDKFWADTHVVMR